MHCINECQTLLNPALLQARLHLGGNVNEGPARRHLKPELFAKAFHC
jgi:hypothetical protein